MSFSFEADALLYGLLTLAAITSVTAIGSRIAKYLLPRPPPFNRNEVHLDPRDPYADLITSWQILDPLFVKQDVNSVSRSPIARTSRLRTISIFLLVAVLTVGTETVLILSTGTESTDLKVPDAQPSTFIARFLGEGRNLRNISFDELDEDKCIVRSNFTVEARQYLEYSESICIGRSEKSHKAGNLSTFMLSTEKSVADNMQLWIGNVKRKPPGQPGKAFDKRTYGTVRIKIDRRVVYQKRNDQRFIDSKTARRMALAMADKSGCSIVGKVPVDEEPLNHDTLQRPAYIANFTCPTALGVPVILDHMMHAALAAYAFYDYATSSMAYTVKGDEFYVDEQKELRVGVRHSEPYEISWYIFMSALTLVGIVWWIIDLWMNRAVNPKIGLLSLMSEEVDDDDCWTNELYRKPKVLYDTNIRDFSTTKPNSTRSTFAPNLSSATLSTPGLSPMNPRSSSAVRDLQIGTGLNVHNYEAPNYAFDNVAPPFTPPDSTP